MKQPSRSPVLYLRAYYFITCWLLASRQRQHGIILLSLALVVYFPVAGRGCRSAGSGIYVTQDLPFSPQMLAEP
jgi:hypothetical protein